MSSNNLVPARLHNDQVQIDPTKKEHRFKGTSSQPAEAPDEMAKNPDGSKKILKAVSQRSRRGSQATQDNATPPQPTNNQPTTNAATLQTNNQPATTNTTAPHTNTRPPPSPSAPASASAGFSLLGSLLNDADNANYSVGSTATQGVVQRSTGGVGLIQPSRNAPAPQVNIQQPAQPSYAAARPPPSIPSTPYGQLVNESNEVEYHYDRADDGDDVDYGDEPLSEERGSNQPSAPAVTTTTNALTGLARTSTEGTTQEQASNDDVFSEEALSGDEIPEQDDFDDGIPEEQRLDDEMTEDQLSVALNDLKQPIFLEGETHNLRMIRWGRARAEVMEKQLELFKKTEAKSGDNSTQESSSRATFQSTGTNGVEGRATDGRNNGLTVTPAQSNAIPPHLSEYELAMRLHYKGEKGKYAKETHAEQYARFLAVKDRVSRVSEQTAPPTATETQHGLIQNQPSPTAPSNTTNNDGHVGTDSGFTNAIGSVVEDPQFGNREPALEQVSDQSMSETPVISSGSLENNNNLGLGSPKVYEATPIDDILARADNPEYMRMNDQILAQQGLTGDMVDSMVSMIASQTDPSSYGDTTSELHEDVRMDDVDIHHSETFPATLMQTSGGGADDTQMPQHYGSISQGDIASSWIDDLAGRLVHKTNAGHEETMADFVDPQDDVRPSIEYVPFPSSIGPIGESRSDSRLRSETPEPFDFSLSPLLQSPSGSVNGENPELAGEIDRVQERLNGLAELVRLGNRGERTTNEEEQLSTTVEFRNTHSETHPTSSDIPADPPLKPARPQEQQMLAGPAPPSRDPDGGPSDDDDNDGKKPKNGDDPPRRRRLENLRHRDENAPNPAQEKSTQDYLREARELRIKQKLVAAQNLFSLFASSASLQRGAQYAEAARKLARESKVDAFLQARCELYVGFGDIVTGEKKSDGRPRRPDWLDSPTNYFQNALSAKGTYREGQWAREWIDYFERDSSEVAPPPDDDDDDNEDGNGDVEDNNDEFSDDKRGSKRNSERKTPGRQKKPYNQENFDQNRKHHGPATTMRLPTQEKPGERVPSSATLSSISSLRGWGHRKRLSWLGLSQEKLDAINQMEKGQSPVKLTFW